MIAIQTQAQTAQTQTQTLNKPLSTPVPYGFAQWLVNVIKEDYGTSLGETIDMARALIVDMRAAPGDREFTLRTNKRAFVLLCAFAQ